MEPKYSIMHLIDSLAIGGAERVAVNLANDYSRENYVVLCVTRRGGDLQEELFPNVKYFCLNRRFRLELRSLAQLLRIIRNHEIQIIHAHSTSIFLAILSKLFIPKVKVIWHIHEGSFGIPRKNHRIYKFIAHKSNGIITVTRSLRERVMNNYKIVENLVWYLPNFVISKIETPMQGLPGTPGFRIVCLANLRPEKDHITLVRAMKIVVRAENKAHLILIGKDISGTYSQAIWREIEHLQLQNHISWLGSKKDIQSILKASDIGVLSSTTEGFPLALLEYGLTGLAVICTRVGECPSVVDNGEGGLLVDPGNPEDLSFKILQLLSNRDLRVRLGSHLQEKTNKYYSLEACRQQLDHIYQIVLQN
jgi:glycosyltransferase involved in cell wall biosynthesis